MNYCISNYLIREKPQYCDRTNKDAKNFQRNVYLTALKLAHENKTKSIIDLGCGAGEKLIELMSNYDTLGIDYEKNYHLCLSKYPDRKWANINLEETIELTILENSLIICSDVIEHLINPDALLNFISNQNCKCIVSTPNRDLIYENKNLGPPKNISHVREWNQEEFENLLKIFNINAKTYTDDKTIIAIVN